MASRWNDGRRFEGRVAIVTGASGALGGASARALAREGASVALAYRSGADAAAQALGEIAAGGGTAYAARLDITDEHSVQAFVDEAVARYGGIDVLINAAGRIDAADAVRFAETDPQAWDALFAVDVKGTFLMCRAVVPHMEARGGGAIVNFAGSYGNGVNQENMVNSVAVSYCAAKGAVRGLHRLARARPCTAHPGQRRLAGADPGQLGCRLGHPGRAYRGSRQHDSAEAHGHAAGDRGDGALPRLGRRRLHHRPDGARRRRLDAGRLGRAAVSLEAIDLAALIPADLPDGRDAVAEGRALGPTIERATSLYCEEKGVGSEREWREKARAEGIPCTCMNIGLATWDDTREAMGLIYEDALSRGVRPPDRFNLLAERRMGLPKELRAQAPQETGPALWTDQHWWEMTHTVPIQPEAADNMIGGPGSVDNVVNALQVGITCIGVLSQYSWRWPYWDDETAQLMAVLKAGGVLASLRDQGVVFDSYLEDGYPGVFHDYASYVGWAMLERYVAEDLIGAAYSSSWGGLTQNPIIKSAVTLALDAVNPHRVPTSFIQGDTIGYSRDFDSNMAVLVNDLMMMKMTDLRYRLGGAPIAVPVTEVERIPSWQEVATVQTVSRKCEDYLPMMEPYVDWGKIEALRDELVAGGKRFFRNALDAMSEMGVDVQDPAPVLLLLKRLGPETCEALFGAGAPDDSYLRGRSPILQTDLVRETMKQREALLAGLAERGPTDGLKAKNVVVASTDVHEFAKFLLTSTLDAAGSNVIDCGINRDPEDIVKVAVETAADAVVITTHNGVARSYGTKLIDEMRDARLDALVFMGGVLNEDIEGSDVPVDVRQDLGNLGIRTPGSIDDLLATMEAECGAKP